MDSTWGGRPYSHPDRRLVAVNAPPHQPGFLPQWLADQKVNVVLAGGMGGRARDLLAQNGIQVVCGVQSNDPTELVQAYMKGDLTDGENTCGHTGSACSGE